MSQPPRRLIRTRHALRRAAQRGISPASVHTALRYGRRYRSWGDVVYRLDRRSVLAARRQGVRIEDDEGIHVVVTRSGVVKTVYRNRTPKRIRR